MSNIADPLQPASPLAASRSHTGSIWPRGRTTPFTARPRAIIPLLASSCLMRMGFAVAWAVACCAPAATYHLHPVRGDDANSGLSPKVPLRSLARVAGLPLQAGDHVLLAAGQSFAGQLTLNGVRGTADAPIVISTYTENNSGTNNKATIDAAGHPAGVLLLNTAHIRVENLRVTGDGGGMAAAAPGNQDMRCGVLVHAGKPGDYAGFRLSHLLIRDVFYEAPGFVRDPRDTLTANGNQRYGWGIRFIVNSPAASLRDITVEDCEIANVSHTGLKFTAPSNGIHNVTVQRLRVKDTGGPGVQMSGLRGGRFRELDVQGSGSTNDTRNWKRGSGLWTWQSSDVVIERSRFQNANGPGDSAGVHIDFHCRDIIVQHNLSANNAGGFCEVLGNNHNTAYRYNVSINDGHRTKARNGFQEGKTFWLSGYTGRKSPLQGPFNTYFYNNTIYVSEEIVAKFAVAPTTRGVLVANNIFYIKGRSEAVAGDQFRPDTGSAAGLPDFVFQNNLFLREDNWPAADLGLRDKSPLLGDPEFQNAGGSKLEDYIPRNISLIRNRGITIPRIPNDEIGLRGGLQVEWDILNNPVRGLPDLGAIELPLTKQAPKVSD